MTGEPQYLEFILEGDEFQYFKNKWYDRVHEYYEKTLLTA
jgi:hypothetical protein